MLTMASVKALFVCYCFFLLLRFFMMFWLRRSTERNTHKKTVYFFLFKYISFVFSLKRNKRDKIINSATSRDEQNSGKKKVEIKRQNKTTKVKKQNVWKTSSLWSLGRSMMHLRILLVIIMDVLNIK